MSVSANTDVFGERTTALIERVATALERIADQLELSHINNQENMRPFLVEVLQGKDNPIPVHSSPPEED